MVAQVWQWYNNNIKEVVNIIKTEDYYVQKKIMMNERQWSSALHSHTPRASVIGISPRRIEDTRSVCIDHRDQEKLTPTITLSRGQESELSLSSLTNEDPPAHPKRFLRSRPAFVHSWKRHGVGFVWLVLPFLVCAVKLHIVISVQIYSRLPTFIDTKYLTWRRSKYPQGHLLRLAAVKQTLMTWRHHRSIHLTRTVC